MVLLFVSFITVSIFMILYDSIKRVYATLDESIGFATKAMNLIKRISGNASK